MTTAVTPETLSPTSNATMFNSYRTYHQTQVWRGESIDPLGLEFSIRKGRIMPVTVTEPPASLNLLKIVRCSCKIGGKTMICLCHIRSLECTDSYKESRRASCVNCQEVNLDLFDENDYFFLLFLIFGS